MLVALGLTVLISAIVQSYRSLLEFLDHISEDIHIAKIISPHRLIAIGAGAQHTRGYGHSADGG